MLVPPRTGPLAPLHTAVRFYIFSLFVRRSRSVTMIGSSWYACCIEIECQCNAQKGSSMTGLVERVLWQVGSDLRHYRDLRAACLKRLGARLDDLQCALPRNNVGDVQRIMGDGRNLTDELQIIDCRLQRTHARLIRQSCIVPTQEPTRKLSMLKAQST